MNGHQSAEAFAKTLEKLEFEDRIIYIKERFSRVILVSEMSVPDQLLTWVLSKRQKLAEIAYGVNEKPTEAQVSLMDVTFDRYGAKIKTPPKLSGVLPAFDAVITYSGHVDDDASFVKWDDQNEQFIFNPLADWSEEQIIAAILEHEIPVNYPLAMTASAKPEIDVPLHLFEGKKSSTASNIKAC